jgi:hypothetical protein
MGNALACIGLDQMHIGPQFGDDGDIEFFADAPLIGQIDVGHVAHYIFGQPIEPSQAIPQARVQEERFSAIGRNRPGTEWQQEYGVLIGSEPEPQRVFLVANEPTALAGLEGACADSRLTRRKRGLCFFLYSLVMAGRSVASIKAMPG